MRSKGLWQKLFSLTLLAYHPEPKHLNYIAYHTLCTDWSPLHVKLGEREGGGGDRDRDLRQTGRQTDRQTDRQRQRHRDRQTD